MKNIAIAFTFAHLIFISTITYAQAWEAQKPFKETYIYGCDPAETGYEEKPACGVVIALSGLKLRSKPSFDAKTLAVIPFGSTVQRTEKGYEFFPYNYWVDIKMTPDSISGYWQEITWNGKKGYAFSAFIGDAIHRMKNGCYLLFETKWACWNDCFASQSYHYYGIFANRDSSQWTLTKIKPSFVHQDIDFPGTWVSSSTKQRPAFMLATKNPIREGLLVSGKTKEVVCDYNIHVQDGKINRKVKIPYSQFTLSVMEKKGPYYESFGHLLLTEKFTGRTQVLLPEITVNKIELVWSGDLDSDGIMDFMLAYSTDETFGCQLFLSSLAKGKQMVGPTNIYWFGDCC